MRKVTLAFAAAAALLAPTLGAQAQTARTNALAALQNGDLQTNYVQWRRWGHGPGYYGGPYRGYYRPRYYGRPYGYHRYARGAGAAARIAGLAGPAIIGGA